VTDDLDAIARRVQALEDDRAILHTLYTYGHGIDYAYEDEWVDGWTEDAVLTWPGREPLHGRGEIGDAYLAQLRATAHRQKHVLVEPRIRLDGDRATVDSYFARLVETPEGPALASFGRYRDVLVRCPDGRWRFAQRVAESESRLPTR
jgi:ketosteroid isomerase-like protein